MTEVQLKEKNKMNHVWLKCEVLSSGGSTSLHRVARMIKFDDAPLSMEDCQFVTIAFMKKYGWHPPAKQMVLFPLPL